MQLAYAYSETTPPAAEAIGNLVQEALANAMSQSNSFLRDQVAKGDPRAKES